MEIITDDRSNLAPRAGEAITQVIEQYPETPLLLLFSGGSALSIIEHIDAQAIDSRVTLSVLDERFGVSEEESNFAQLATTDFYANATAAGAFTIDPRGIEGEGLEENARWFEAALYGWQQKNPGGIVVATQGIGDDGHTAGILPFADNVEYFTATFDQTDRWAVGYEVSAEKSAYTQRITVTVPFLRTIVTSGVVYAVGEKKQQVLSAVLNQPDASQAKMPARVINQMNDILLCTDQDIA